jgi:DNA mismatch endonuclease (patch repair protein)
VDKHLEPGPAPPASSVRDFTGDAPDQEIRHAAGTGRALHGRGLRFVVDRPMPGGNRRRRVDILLRGARIAVFVDGCFWHSCPDHSHLPKTNTSWWRLKFRGIARRDRDTDTQLVAAGWLAVRIWEQRTRSKRLGTRARPSCREGAPPDSDATETACPSGT